MRFWWWGGTLNENDKLLFLIPENWCVERAQGPSDFFSHNLSNSSVHPMFEFIALFSMKFIFVGKNSHMKLTLLTNQKKIYQDRVLWKLMNLRQMMITTICERAWWQRNLQWKVFDQVYNKKKLWSLFLGRQCYPQRSALLKSMLNFIKKAIPDVSFSDSIRHCKQLQLQLQIT